MGGCFSRGSETSDISHNNRSIIDELERLTSELYMLKRYQQELLQLFIQQHQQLRSVMKKDANANANDIVSYQCYYGHRAHHAVRHTHNPAHAARHQSLANSRKTQSATGDAGTGVDLTRTYSF